MSNGSGRSDSGRSDSGRSDSGRSGPGRSGAASGGEHQDSLAEARRQLEAWVRQSLPADVDPDIVDVFNTNTFHFRADALDRDFDMGWYLVHKTVDGRPAVQVERLIGRSETLHGELWSRAVEIAAQAPTPVSALFVQSLNELIDLQLDFDVAVTDRLGLHPYRNVDIRRTGAVL